MKATKLLIAVALFTGLTSLSFAGPGIDYWNRTAEAAKNRTATEAKAKPEAPKANAPKPANEVAATCATCTCCAKKV